jgi:hypothetical protein
MEQRPRDREQPGRERARARAALPGIIHNGGSRAVLRARTLVLGVCPLAPYLQRLSKALQYMYLSRIRIAPPSHLDYCCVNVQPVAHSII